ncbi:MULTISPECIES: FkbM family methyltransferase [unclassified Kaistella]|uniref:FkbM family methyltransferase n=1 Tax=unclassified Kaistella TaxID=2762626 RepID=UPI00273551A2|nr:MULTISPECIES: FkbM family methyltransferase [unclassified Kaistella]MDP2454928.1 FkbM family methyltransferase [Kaistella sp. SH11-4b]MDP2456089.1 FkbM family methyltransferase [Kaistella sp. SH40-3]MDP2460598.1 FkbM family methyltransferase [Kaistella sp. SH19-2b]
MINKLKKLHQLYKQERYKENVQFLQNPKTGLSPADKERALHYPDFTDGEVNFFGKPFRFSHGSSFIHSVDELFEEEVYRFKSDIDNPYIIDCGANIGLSIMYFKKLFPKSKILAFEPDEKIFNILKENIFTRNTFNDITIKKEAVWIDDTELSFFSEGALAGSSVVDFGKKNNVIKVQAINLKKYLLEPVDFLKIDIEGAENTVIFDIANHLGNVKNLFLEYHGLLNEPQNLGEILTLLKKQGFEYYIRVAGNTLKFPFCNETPSNFNQQLNIFCYRKIY